MKRKREEEHTCTWQILVGVVGHCEKKNAMREESAQQAGVQVEKRCGNLDRIAPIEARDCLARLNEWREVERINKQARRGRRDVVTRVGDEGVLPNREELAFVAFAPVRLALLGGLLLLFVLLRAAIGFGLLRLRRRRCGRAAAVDVRPRHEEERENSRLKRRHGSIIQRAASIAKRISDIRFPVTCRDARSTALRSVSCIRCDATTEAIHGKSREARNPTAMTEQQHVPGCTLN